MPSGKTQRRRLGWFYGCFRRRETHGGGMSLNRFEQRIFDYWQGHRDERQFWQEKVRALVKTLGDDHAAATRLDGEFWRYYVERSGVVPAFKDAARHDGLQRTSMKNLAELVIRIWVEPRPKKKKVAEEGAGMLPGL
jgi:hypothetical protein